MIEPKIWRLPTAKVKSPIERSLAVNQRKLRISPFVMCGKNASQKSNPKRRNSSTSRSARRQHNDEKTPEWNERLLVLSVIEKKPCAASTDKTLTKSAIGNIPLEVFQETFVFKEGTVNALGSMAFQRNPCMAGAVRINSPIERE